MRVFAKYVQRCRIRYGTSAPKTVTQFFVMNIIWTRYYYSLTLMITMDITRRFNVQIQIYILALPPVVSKQASIYTHVQCSPTSVGLIALINLIWR